MVEETTTEETTEDEPVERVSVPEDTPLQQQPLFAGGAYCKQGEHNVESVYAVSAEAVAAGEGTCPDCARAIVGDPPQAGSDSIADAAAAEAAAAEEAAAEEAAAEEAAAGEEGADRGPDREQTAEERVAALEEQATKAELLAMADELDLDVSTRNTKAELAAAIVEAQEAAAKGPVTEKEPASE